MTSYKETLIKTLIWRFIATMITFTITWIVSGNLTIGLLIGGIDTLIKTIGYFGYERFWNNFSKFIVREKK